jgi:signal transduction histidine kinase
MQQANRGVLRFDFMREVSKILLNHSGADAVELRLKERNKFYKCEVRRGTEPESDFQVMTCVQDDNGQVIPCSRDDRALEQLCVAIVGKTYDSKEPFFTQSGSFFTGDTTHPLFLHVAESSPRRFDLSSDEDYVSLVLIPIVVDGSNVGLLQLKSSIKNSFSEERIEFYEVLIQTLGVAIVHRRAQLALRERIKELTCLNDIASIVAAPGRTLPETLNDIAELLPPAWLYPDIASARITLDNKNFSTSGYRDSPWKQSAPIVIEGERRGIVEVVYSEERPELDEGPFLKEERDLIDTIARELAIIVERKQSEEEKSKLTEQLRHADRLATIGQLAAGIAHELNEPLGNILGFAQLSMKQPDLPHQVAADLEKIANASLFSREVIKKLMIFARRMPTRKIPVDLNQVVEDGLYFFESRAAKAGVELRKLLSPESPELMADPAQLAQVLVNLVVNSLQAMSEGGTLTVRTERGKEKQWVALIVEDTGTGMPDKVREQIFLPFFTTKDINEGTGLGLAVVHGIVTSHGGTIDVSSAVGQGTRFEIRLPVASDGNGIGGNAVE